MSIKVRRVRALNHRGTRPKVRPDMTGLRAEQVVLVSPVTRVEGIPDRLMLANAPTEYMPGFSFSTIGPLFFGTREIWLGRLIRERIDWAEAESGPVAFHRPEHNSREFVKLEGVERLIHVLYRQKLITYAKFVVALNIVAWIGRAYDVYA